MKYDSETAFAMILMCVLIIIFVFKIDNLEKENRALKSKIVELTTDDETGVVGHPKAVVEIQEIGVL